MRAYEKPGRRLLLGAEAAAPPELALPSAQGRRGKVGVSSKGKAGVLPPTPVSLLLVTLFVPCTIQVASLALSPYRIILIGMILPCLGMWLTGKAGRIRVPDIALLLFCLWSALSLSVIHGPAIALQPGGMLFIETMGGYLMARCFIRNAQDFRKMALLLFRIVAVLLPFAVLEAFTKHNLLLEFFSMLMPTHIDYYMEPRWGLRRVQSVFEHPILFGVSSGGILAIIYFVLGHGETAGRRIRRTATVVATAFLSLSSGPISALIAQMLLIVWDRSLVNVEGRWKILWGAVLLLYVIVSLASNQSVPEFYLTHFSFDQASAYYRILIWEFGSASALNHPLFGVGLNEWDRPAWMPPSLDMFWLIFAVFHGIPAGLLIVLTFFSATLAVGFRACSDPYIAACKAGYLISMTGYFLVGWTVHFWNATYVLFLFLLASGVWILDLKVGDHPTSPQRKPVPAAQRPCSAALADSGRRRGIPQRRERV